MNIQRKAICMFVASGSASTLVATWPSAETLTAFFVAHIGVITAVLDCVFKLLMERSQKWRTEREALVARADAAAAAYRAPRRRRRTRGAAPAELPGVVSDPEANRPSESSSSSPRATSPGLELR